MAICHLFKAINDINSWPTVRPWFTRTPSSWDNALRHWQPSGHSTPDILRRQGRNVIVRKSERWGDGAQIGKGKQGAEGVDVSEIKSKLEKAWLDDRGVSSLCCLPVVLSGTENIKPLDDDDNDKGHGGKTARFICFTSWQ
ncbi:hypothetical protein CONPUDRAFT_71626 [Coniophora puteana RWD-64-598 SS2]|uniref:Uncharacterized protein n=1 Tax=Coniophora puteana (strain RWD-64-598) TaxID=741705 RepID=A0A5M3MVD9_CONPW|nr:uncharacterized protein CONPUDRAFT_71626 [Coniophora puteana RWD-64-598 SS2]EIW82977.1 hypothetical protein CONPUDRAFT_71626 [Coniophora puteana RWD-64-598 SS2]